MRKRNKTKQMSRPVGHRKAMKRNMLASIIVHGQIQTTLPKAKFIRPFIEKLVTKARTDSQANRRLVQKHLFSKEAVEKLFIDIAPRYNNRSGGYTRIVKLGPRKGDVTEMAIIQFV